MVELKEGKYSPDEWNEIMPIIRTETVDISAPLPDKFSMVYMNEFDAVVYHKPKQDFYKIVGSCAFVTIEKVNDTPIKDIYK